MARILTTERRPVVIFAGACCLTGVALQMAQSWASVVGDALLVAAALAVSAQSLSIAIGERSTSTSLHPLWPIAAGFFCGALFWAYYLIVDANVVITPSVPLRVAIGILAVLFGLWYLLLMRRCTAVESASRHTRPR